MQSLKDPSSQMMYTDHADFGPGNLYIPYPICTSSRQPPPPLVVELPIEVINGHRLMSTDDIYDRLTG